MGRDVAGVFLMSGLGVLFALLFSGGAWSGVEGGNVHELYAQKNNTNRSVACGVCEGRGGHLARYPAVSDWDLLFGNLSHLKNDLYWVDLVKMGATWVWGNNTPVDLAHISALPMNPSFAGNYSTWSCAVWSMAEPFYIIANCSMPAGILCQLPASAGCKYREMAGKQFDSAVSTQNVTMATGKEECLSKCSGSGVPCWAVEWRQSTMRCRMLSGGTSTSPPATPGLDSHPDYVVFGKSCLNFTEMSPENSEFVCNCGAIDLPGTPQEKKQFLEEHKEEVKKELIVPTETLSATIRKKESAPDKRTSSTSIGYLGVTLMVVVFGGLVLMDLTSLIAHVKMAATNVKTAIVTEEENATEA